MEVGSSVENGLAPMSYCQWNRTPLWRRLLSRHINGRILNAVQTIPAEPFYNVDVLFGPVAIRSGTLCEPLCNMCILVAARTVVVDTMKPLQASLATPTLFASVTIGASNGSRILRESDRARFAVLPRVSATIGAPR